ncbi:MAG: hypothetical protein HOP29_02365 [Phycisphaerales bacterium]|nr:hypothetical protein [Phycisphaerales bacterium]
MLDPQAAARAVAQPSEIESAASSSGYLQQAATRQSTPPDDIPLIKREVVLNAEADATLTRLVDLFRRSTGTRLSTSHALRALLKGVAHCMGSLEREAGRVGRLRLPSNARGREAERERFEHRLAGVVVNGMRASAAYERDDK